MKCLLDHDVPDEVAFGLQALGHEVTKVREVLPVNSSDDDVLRKAGECGALLVTCNRDDFLAAATRVPHHGMVILIRRRTRAQERAALVRLLDQAGEAGLRDNINFA